VSLLQKQLHLQIDRIALASLRFILFFSILCMHILMTNTYRPPFIHLKLDHCHKLNLGFVTCLRNCLTRLNNRKLHSTVKSTFLCSGWEMHLKGTTSKGRRRRLSKCSASWLIINCNYQAPLLWDQLPPSVREADTVTSFKSRLKTFLFDSLIVRAESGSPGPAPWYAAIGL